MVQILGKIILFNLIQYLFLPSGIFAHELDDQAAPKIPCRLLITEVTYLVQALGKLKLFNVGVVGVVRDG